MEWDAPIRDFVIKYRTPHQTRLAAVEIQAKALTDFEYALSVFPG
jgi:hypothetical protein